MSIVRTIRGHRDSDRERAYQAERRAAEDAARPRLHPRLRSDMAQIAATGIGVTIGSAVHDAALPVRLGSRDIAGEGHALVVGASGSGKTRVVGGIVRELLRRRLAGEPGPGVCLMDHKSEFTQLVRALYADLVAALPADERERALDDLAVIDPFSKSHLVPMQILRREPGVAPEVQAFEVTSLIARAGGAELGVRQDSFLYHLVHLGILKDMTLVDLARLVTDEEALARVAAAAPSRELRAYFSGSGQISRDSLAGVQSRLHRLLRLPSTRLMLGTRDSAPISAHLGRKILAFDTGSPDLGCEDIGRFYAGLFTLRLTRAIFSRTHEDARRPVAVFVDEWQEGLAAGAESAEQYERLLAMARSRGVSLWLSSQSLAVAGRVSSSLPRVVATNTNLQLLFRSSLQDARELAHVLPITGRRPRDDAHGAERTSAVLSKAEEREALIAEATSLPDRTFYLWNRRAAYPAVLVRAGDVRPSERRTTTGVAERLARGALGMPVGELERELRERTTRAERIGRAVLRPRTPPHAPLAAPSRRPRRRGPR